MDWVTKRTLRRTPGYFSSQPKPHHRVWLELKQCDRRRSSFAVFPRMGAFDLLFPFHPETRRTRSGTHFPRIKGHGPADIFHSGSI